MSDKFVIQGQKTLSGEIEVRGSKNAAGPILAACLLTDKECEIDNLPLIEDIFNILEVLKSMGVEVENISERKVKIKAEKVEPEKMDFEKISKTRISVLLFGSLLARAKHFKISPPGGDRIGLRPISVQLKALEKLGAKIERNDEVYKVDCDELRGTEIVLEEFSVTATEAVILAAALAEGKTIIKGAAAEPHVQDLGEMLLKMGAKIEGLGTHTIKIEGVEKLHGCNHSVIPDPIEAGTFIVIGALTPGRVKVTGVDLSHLDLFLAKLEEMSVNIEKGKDYVAVSHSPNLNAVKVQALPYPGFPTDLLPIIIPLLISAKGKSLVHDPLYENRFNYIHQLRKMGAEIEMVDPHRTFVFGPAKLSGSKIDSWDIRAGACLVIAAMGAEGKTTIENIYQIDRGYEKIEERLQKIGADIKRISN
ncbi:MAG: UDP-N-acetylglucosamine 1-carboxyvinyltransferase [Parcubacteria group bacterium GW2011_GWA1_36_12]|nr:MAG: UDP-N-acetylglucosamine 1-carboxyvinyltransferase [Parcubacteria group bacterium GW2011_GWA1_36_12]